MLHCHYLKESLHVNFSRKALQFIGDFGIIGFVSGAALTLFYLFLEIYYKAGMYQRAGLETNFKIVGQGMVDDDDDVPIKRPLGILFWVQ